MAKESKNIISRETCKKDLKHLAKADLYFDLILLVIVSLIFIPLMFIGIYLLKHILIFGIITIAVCATPSVIFVCKLINHIMKVRLVNRDGFSIVMDTVCRLSKGEPEARHTVDVIYFTKYGRYIPSQTTFDLTSIGDVFYLVVLHTKKKEPSFVFHSMMYEWTDLD